MNNHPLRWLKGLLAFGIALAVLFGGQLAWHNYAFSRPLDKALQNIPGVENVHLRDSQKSGLPVTLDITLGRVENLAATYSAMQEQTTQALGDQPFRLVIHDHRNAELEQVYYTIHFYIYQAIMTGDYPLMARQCQTIASSQGVNAKLYVDSQYVYVQLDKGNEFLYQLVPRTPDRKEGVTNAAR